MENYNEGDSMSWMDIVKDDDDDLETEVSGYKRLLEDKIARLEASKNRTQVEVIIKSLIEELNARSMYYFDIYGDEK